MSERLDKIADDITEIKVTLAKQHVSLDQHILRTNLLEESVSLLRSDVEPVKKHVAAVESILKFIGFIALIIGAVLAVKEILQ